MALNFNNPYERDAVFDIAFERTNFDGFTVHPRLELPEDPREIVGGWVEDLGEFLQRLGREIEGQDRRNEHRERRHPRLDRVARSMSCWPRRAVTRQDNGHANPAFQRGHCAVRPFPTPRRQKERPLPLGCHPALRRTDSGWQQLRHCDGVVEGISRYTARRAEAH